MPTEREVIARIELLLRRMKALNDRLSKARPPNDLRLAIVGLPGNVLHSYFFQMWMAEYTITHKVWWQEVFGRYEPLPPDLQAIRNLESMSKHATFVFFLSRIEWCLRKLITHMYPGACGHGSAAFKNIYDYLFGKLGLDRFIPLFDVCRNVRNAVHSNGIFISRAAVDESIVWRDRTYSFAHMKPIDFMTYDVMFGLYSDLIDFIETLVSNEKVAAPPFIEDRVH
jgi:hypothetical protein